MSKYHEICGHNFCMPHYSVPVLFFGYVGPQRLSHIHIPSLSFHLRDSVCPLHARDAGGGEDERGVLDALLIVQLTQPRVQVAPDVGDRQVGVSRPESFIISSSAGFRYCDHI